MVLFAKMIRMVLVVRDPQPSVASETNESSKIGCDASGQRMVD